MVSCDDMGLRSHAPYYSFWLVPQEPDFTYLQTLITTLANRFGTVSFCPHVTLYSGPLPSPLAATQVCDALRATPLELAVVSLGHTSHFTKTLYVQLRPSPELSHLVSSLVAAIPNAEQPPQPNLDPHVSLLYHTLESSTQQRVTDHITLPRPTLRFDQVQVISAPQNFATQAHVSQLRHVHSHFLTTP